MSQPDLTSQPRVASGQKAKSSVYTGLMGLAAMCLAIGCLMLIIEINRYATDAGASSGWFGVVK